MKVNLVWITPNAESLIAYIARVSNPENQDNPNYEKLIRYLINNKHWSPFEMASMCVEIETSRAISAQILRHRSFSFQEFSQRYAEVQEIEPFELRKQSDKNRQSSTEVFNPVTQHIQHERDWDSSYDIRADQEVQELLVRINGVYKRLVEAGVAKECARMILPMASSTTLYMNGTMRSWIHYLQLRDDEHAQLEHQLIAKEIKKIFIEQLPIISQALGW